MMTKLLVMKKLLSCRVDETLLTKLVIRAAEDTIATKSKVGVGEVIERLIDAKLTVDKNTVLVGSSECNERVKRLQEENERLGRELIQVKEDAVAYQKSAKTRGNDEDPSLVKQAVEVATKNCREELEKVKADRDKWKASAETFRGKLAPGIKTGADLAAERELTTNYLKK